MLSEIINKIYGRVNIEVKDKGKNSIAKPLKVFLCLLRFHWNCTHTELHPWGEIFFLAPAGGSNPTGY